MIDVIIPSYNSHKTIKRCLLSIAYQRNKNELNVIIVNDGSSADYKSEVDYFSRFIKIKELKIKNTRGPGYARQFGLNNSKGKYVIFIDSDDVLYSPLSILELKRKIEKDKSDIVISDYIVQNENKELKILDNTLLGLHGKIYRRSFLENNNIYFFNLTGEEDTNFNNQCYLKDAKISYLNITTYIYLFNKKSLTKCNNYYESNIEYYLDSINHLIELTNINKVKLKELCYRALLNSYFEDYMSNKLNKIYECYKDLRDLYIDEINIYKEFICDKEDIDTMKKITFSSYLDLIGGNL